MPNVLTYDSTGRRPTAKAWLITCVVLAVAQFPWFTFSLFNFYDHVSMKRVDLFGDSLSYGFIASATIISTIASGFAFFRSHKSNYNLRTKLVLLVCFIVSMSMVAYIALEWYYDVYCYQGQIWVPG